MENFRSIAEQTLADAKSQKGRLTEEALKCHDVLVVKERQLDALWEELENLRREKAGWSLKSSSKPAFWLLIPTIVAMITTG